MLPLLESFSRSGGKLSSMDEAMAQDDLGRVIGLNRGLGSLDVIADSDRVVVSITISSGDVVRGIRVLFDVEIADLVDGPTARDGS